MSKPLYIVQNSNWAIKAQISEVNGAGTCMPWYSSSRQPHEVCQRPVMVMVSG